MLLAFAPRASAQSEDALKSAFLFNFAKFVTWPDSAFSDGSFQVGFIGADGLAGTFEKAVTGKNVGGRSITVKKGSGDGCQIVFVGDGGKVSEVISAAQGKPVLTVSDVDGFVDQSGIIGFVTDGSKIGFELNAKQAESGGLQLDDKLKKIAKNVKG